jgi:hypothetical protein
MDIQNFSQISCKQWLDNVYATNALTPLEKIKNDDADIKFEAVQKIPLLESGKAALSFFVKENCFFQTKVINNVAEFESKSQNESFKNLLNAALGKSYVGYILEASVAAKGQADIAGNKSESLGGDLGVVFATFSPHDPSTTFGEAIMKDRYATKWILSPNVLEQTTIGESLVLKKRMTLAAKINFNLDDLLTQAVGDISKDLFGGLPFSTAVSKGAKAGFSTSVTDDFVLYITKISEGHFDVKIKKSDEKTHEIAASFDYGVSSSEFDLSTFLDKEVFEKTLGCATGYLDKLASRDDITPEDKQIYQKIKLLLTQNGKKEVPDWARGEVSDFQAYKGFLARYKERFLQKVKKSFEAKVAATVKVAYSTCRKNSLVFDAEMPEKLLFDNYFSVLKADVTDLLRLADDSTNKGLKVKQFLIIKDYRSSFTFSVSLNLFGLKVKFGKQSTINAKEEHDKASNHSSFSFSGEVSEFGSMMTTENIQIASFFSAQSKDKFAKLLAKDIQLEFYIRRKVTFDNTPQDLAREIDLGLLWGGIPSEFPYRGSNDPSKELHALALRYNFERFKSIKGKITVENKLHFSDEYIRTYMPKFIGLARSENETDRKKMMSLLVYSAAECEHYVPGYPTRVSLSARRAAYAQIFHALHFDRERNQIEDKEILDKLSASLKNFPSENADEIANISATATSSAYKLMLESKSFLSSFDKFTEAWHKILNFGASDSVS